MITGSQLDALRRSVVVNINGDLLDKARALDINLSETLEQALIEIFGQNRRKQWQEENRQAMNAYTGHIEIHGVFSDGLRDF
ncbi:MULTISPECIES: type II toxin-antitoxin system CcdA family antitoxin [unclassified Pseudomonas]|uniref:type II toxin-antitoxin system CcdA family antitoxin n=1 Tax=unclassified Pseudomonas TaxID=196821 RepID=UPI00249F8217|nr:type II toxin-antitoxin system CcdA family antitoxin [Pseudomonas sp. UYIF39]MDI3358597.1 type II toxin-antitoxin system CcdA family antitoxin [Pseudomonas sp. UYIF39]